MSKCKYPDSVCINMTLLNGVAYCDGVPCSLRGELPPTTNADHIRSLNAEELANLLCINGWRLWETSECLDWLCQPWEGDED